VTCFYVSIHDETFAQHLQSIGMYSDFYPGFLVARQLMELSSLWTDHCHNPFAPRWIGGYEAIENKPADDLLVAV